MNEFDTWRKNYESLTTEQQAAYHDELESRYPEQNHFKYENVKEALRLIDKPFFVLEFGAWKGDLASKALNDFDIVAWAGIEICPCTLR